MGGWFESVAATFSAAPSFPCHSRSLCLGHRCRRLATNLSTFRSLGREGGGGKGVAALRGNSVISPSTFPNSAVTYTADISTDLPLYEPPWASFDDYLEDRPRIFRAMFPDKRRSQRINDEEWMIRMLPIQFLLVSVNPTVVMRLRCRSQGENYPPGVSLSVKRILELRATRVELHGLDSVNMPSYFDLDVQGMLYSDRRGGRSRLKGKLVMSISLVLPQVLALVPDDILRGVAESVLKRLLETMKREVDGSLLADFKDFSREMRIEKGKKASLQFPVSASPDTKGDSR